MSDPERKGNFATQQGSSAFTLEGDVGDAHLDGLGLNHDELNDTWTSGPYTWSDRHTPPGEKEEKYSSFFLETSIDRAERNGNFGTQQGSSAFTLEGAEGDAHLDGLGLNHDELNDTWTSGSYTPPEEKEEKYSSFFLETSIDRAERNGNFGTQQGSSAFTLEGAEGDAHLDGLGLNHDELNDTWTSGSYTPPEEKEEKYSSFFLGTSIDPERNGNGNRHTTPNGVPPAAVLATNNNRATANPTPSTANKLVIKNSKGIRRIQPPRMAARKAKKMKMENAQSSSSKIAQPAILEDIIQNRQACASSIMEFAFNKKRIKVLSNATDVPETAEGILYWMSRDQRIHDNWAMLYAQKLAIKNKLPLSVCFCLLPNFLDATIRHYDFMLNGLKEVEKECIDLNISFHLLVGQANDVLPSFVKTRNIGAVVVDFSPLRGPRKWVADITKSLPENIPFCQVDAHNIVPCWIASDKLEYAARTIRSKIHAKLGEYLTQFPPLVKHAYSASEKEKPKAVNWKAAEESLVLDRTVLPVEGAKPGAVEAYKVLETFLQERIKNFSSKRNDPNADALSNLSPWFHFGQISIQQCILVVKQTKKYPDSVAAFCEEAIVRRELADNFCYYNDKYDSLEGANEWARITLDVHKKDKRQFIYSRADLEQSNTHDNLWNAAQFQMVKEGKMHGFMRMYWAKKILEWTSSPEEALSIAIYLNDRYSLDGRDPNGFVGCMWSICGIHDQGWAERPVFGKIRYMNFEGCKRKFDVNSYVTRYVGKGKVPSSK